MVSLLKCKAPARAFPPGWRKFEDTPPTAACANIFNHYGQLNRGVLVTRYQFNEGRAEGLLCRRILRDKDWAAQVNVRNLQNRDSDALTVVRRQPDGAPARERFDPPLQALLTNTFRF